MIPVSIIIVAKNEADVIGKCLESVTDMTNDTIVCDTGSADDTIKIAAEKGARIIQLPWQGYGQTKNIANTYAKYEWVLQLDADEFIDDTLKQELSSINWQNLEKAFSIRRKRFFMNKILQFGAWGNEKRIRLFPRKSAKWTEDLVHETLKVDNLKIITLKGYIYDQTFKDTEQFSHKMENYANMCAQKYLIQKVKGAGWKRYLSPIYTFFWNYFIRLGFLDGKAGIMHAYMIANYTYRKYSVLHQLEQKK